MTVENVYRVFMKLVVCPKDMSDFGAYKCIANNTLGETEKIIHLHRKLTTWRNCFFTKQTNRLIWTLFHSTDKSKSNDARNIVLSNQVDSTEIFNNGMPDHMSLIKAIHMWKINCAIFHFRFLGLSILFIWIDFSADSNNISVVKYRCDRNSLLHCIVTAFFSRLCVSLRRIALHRLLASYLHVQWTFMINSNSPALDWDLNISLYVSNLKENKLSINIHQRIMCVYIQEIISCSMVGKITFGNSTFHLNLSYKHSMRKHLSFDIYFKK